MVHYASDVLAGWLIGILAGIAGYFIARALSGVINKALDKRAAGSGKKPGKYTVSSLQLTVTCFTAGLVIFLISFIPLLNKANHEALRCSYNGDYKCYNEIGNPDKYPPIDGESYCKIHWNELSKTN